MENSVPLLSICIPTNGAVEWVIPVIDSIYAQGVENSLYEVIVTDNGENNNLQEAVKKYGYSNFHYSHNNSKGFTNQIDAFEKCQGVFCKMLNHRSRMRPGSIEAILGIVRKYQFQKPILYFAEGLAKGGDIIECQNTDEFVKRLGVWCSWSAGVGAWKEDIKSIRSREIDSTFPHTALLFDLREKPKYVIWNGLYEVMASDEGKGGYDLFNAFGVRLLDLLNKLRIKGEISIQSYLYLKKDVYAFLQEQYLREVLLPTKHSFIIKNVRESIEVYFGRLYYYNLVIWAWVRKPLVLFKILGYNTINKIKSKK